MDWFKILRVYSAVASLVELVKSAQADGRLTAQELYTIVFSGLAPVLDLFGVKLLPLENSPQLEELSKAARERDAALAGLLKGFK